MPWISPHNCHEKRPRREPDITRRKCCEKLAATRHIRSLFGKMRKTAVCSAVDRKSQATSPRAGPPPSRLGWGCGWAEGASAVVPAPNVAVGFRAPRASRGARFLLPGSPPRVTSTGCLCYFHRGRGKGRLHIFPEAVARPGRGRCPLSAAGAAVPCTRTHASTPYGALERRNPLKYFHIRPKIYALGVYFRAPAESAATAGSAAGRAGTGSTPTCPPTQQPPAPPQLTKANHWVCN